MSNSQETQVVNDVNHTNNVQTKHRKTRSQSLFIDTKIIQQKWKYPAKQISILLNDDNTALQQIMDNTHCKITIHDSMDHSDHKMVEITLEGTTEQIFNGHKEINYIRQNGHLMADKERKQNRFGQRGGFRNRHQPKKLMNWNLDVTDPSMLETINNISSDTNPTNWAILRFQDNDQGINNLKILNIEKCGEGGISNLAKQLSNIKQLKYCVLRFDYGFDINRHQIILIIWSPSTARNGQKRNIIPILRHKSMIKNTLKATFELTISIHSHLHSNFILSELHSKNLMPEILLRVTKRKTIYDDDDDDEDDDYKMNINKTKSSPNVLSAPSLTKPSTLFQQKTTPNLEYAETHKFFASKDWTLRQLKHELGKKYNMNPDDIQITNILHFVKQRSKKFNAPQQTEHIFNKQEDLEKTLSDLRLHHGSRIYISLDTQKKRLSNRYLAAQRRLQFTKIKTMSKTHKIKIKLKLSTHIKNLKSLQSLKTMKETEIAKQKVPQKVSLRVAKYEHQTQTREKSKSVFYSNSPSTTIKKAQSSDIDHDNDNDIDIEMKQDIAAESDHDVEMINKSHSMPTHKVKLTRTRSLSTTLTEGLSQQLSMRNIVDQQAFEEYTKPQIFEPVVVEKLIKMPSRNEEEEKKETEEEKDDDEEDEDHDTTIFEDEESILPFPSSTSSLQTYASASFSSSDLAMTEIECTLDLNDVFIVEKSVGRGKTAHVHYAIYRDECDIALKEFRFGRLTDKILLDFHSELETLRKLDHDNICRLLGSYIDEKSKQLYLAFEWLPGGCLYDVIHDEQVTIEYIDVLEMAIDIARGMKYLHSQKIIHRDLKSHNLLLDEAYRIKITDFGTAKSLEKITGTTYTEVGTGGYCAPEVIEPPLQGYDRKIDVFSYGVLLWEIYERKNIFDQRCLRNINQLRQGIRPKISQHCPIKFKNLIEKCWQFDPQKRPNFDKITSILLQMYAEKQ